MAQNHVSSKTDKREKKVKLRHNEINNLILRNKVKVVGFHTKLKPQFNQLNWVFWFYFEF